MWQPNLRGSSFLVLFTLLFLSTQTPLVGFSTAGDYTNVSDLSGISVKVMVSSSSSYGSAPALHSMFEWMNATVDYISADEVNSTTLANCDILAAPGGSEFACAIMLGQEGKAAILDFVSSGGSYFGICGGATLGTNYFLGLFNGTMRRPVPGVESGTYMIQLSVNQSSLGPDLSNQPENITALYWESAYFSTHNWTGIHRIVTYPNSGYSAMVTFEYGSGSVFLSSPHPEYEEDDDRDGTGMFDYLADPESEWGLLMDVACWLIEVSPSASGNGTDEGRYLLVAAVVMVGIVALVVLVFARNRLAG